MRPLNPLAALTLILVFPGRTFRRLVDRPHWILPLVFVMCAAVLSGLLALAAGFMDESIELEALRTGHDPVEIREGTPAAMVVSGIVGVTGATLLQALLLMAVARLFHGGGTFRRAFSAVCHASVPIGVSAILLMALIPFTHTAMSGLSLAFAVDQASSPFLWGLASQLDLAAIWFFVLLGIAAEPVFELPRRRARLAALVFGIVLVLVLGWMGRDEAIRRVDPYSDWSRLESRSVVLRFGSEESEETLREIAQGCERATERVWELTGLAAGRTAGEAGEGRIDCYLYPSLDEKRLVTDNAAMAHRVEWAGAVHLAWIEGAEPVLTREMLKLADAKTHGKVYTPLIRDGLAVYAGRTWGGMPVRMAGADLLERRVLPGLDMLVDTVAFVRLDERISQPAAGSFMAFLAEENGVGVVRDLYSDSAGRSEGTEALLEATLGESLGAMEERWLAYLRFSTDTPDAPPRGER
ncbi:MAG: YIP1 family protein, partial [Candidatus Eisenbacteria sp.]|nr:YIP1 family protein [Candidatus Eisenbacteria bacterium]